MVSGKGVKKPTVRRPQTGRHLSALTGTGSKKRRAKIKGSGVGVFVRMVGGSSIRTPRGPASPETRSETGNWRRTKYPPR